ncbi:archaeosortase A [Methanocella sp. CWC-04]|uniref:Archaeosortase A n=1 Tax=Methanooceanicella nereidis TaxID=2052831 RepID=A0AAP2W551_9EURY|nr:archaeosortase A [Methanocella sp. CWC-04]MCD1295125.1 archaeosortase A [Methanocella sp. CWC-04]
MEFIDIMLWASLLLFVIGALLPKDKGFKVAAAGWILFGFRWGVLTPDFYFNEHNILYTIACALAIPVTLYMAYIMVRYERESLMILTRSAAISSIFYFPFANIPELNRWLIDFTTSVTIASVNAFGQGALRTDFDMIMLNGFPVQIILACTAIQSMALFVGVVGCIKAPLDRKVKAFMISVPVIYLLNFVRNTFVISAYGNQWFQIIPETIVGWTGEPASYASFFWAHNVLAELGSIIALIFISYAVITLLPETITYIRDIFKLINIENVKRSLKGQEIAEAIPIPREK